MRTTQNMIQGFESKTGLSAECWHLTPFKQYKYVVGREWPKLMKTFLLTSEILVQTLRTFIHQSHHFGLWWMCVCVGGGVWGGAPYIHTSPGHGVPHCVAVAGKTQLYSNLCAYNVWKGSQNKQLHIQVISGNDLHAKAV